MQAKTIKVVSLRTGKPREAMYRGKEVATAIFKEPVSGPVFLSSHNLAGDEQADKVNHGGLDKAVCVYSLDRYPYFGKVLGRRLDGGAFGENVTVSGLDEEGVCIGDVFQWGEALVQVSQPRKPCFKVALKLDLPDLPLQMEQTGYTGFYLRVLKEGWVAPDSELKLQQRHPKAVTIAFVNHARYHDKKNGEAIRRILEVDELAESWRTVFEKRLSQWEEEEA
ncbi:MOSC domain-containing protein [Brevibacillus sp. B_LB10_24]|uniref:MOSC domain-containing protein n=1 Tax=Brevibacillus sp. B_LB10_24 TaxID=3380645 RepID=UPI0038B6CD33